MNFIALKTSGSEYMYEKLFRTDTSFDFFTKNCLCSGMKIQQNFHQEFSWQEEVEWNTNARKAFWFKEFEI